MKSALDVIDIEKRFNIAKQGFSNHTMMMFFNMMDRRDQTMDQLKFSDHDPKIIKDILDEFKESIIEILGL